MLNILLIDADSKIPNLALMKLSTYHKQLNHNITLVKANISYYPSRQKEVIIDAKEYNKVYISYIFENSNKFLKVINNNNVIIGGVGVDLITKLPVVIESLNPDYSIYPDNDVSYGFITRGCIRKCEFCKVHKSEGMLSFNQHPKDIIKHKKVKFLDNNFLAYKHHINILEWLINNNIKFQFNQALDIRLLNNNNAELLSLSNYLGEYMFAFDNLSDKILLNSKLIILKKYISKEWACKFFLYCNAEMNIYNDVLYRVKWCYKNKILPYLMRDINCWNSENNHFYIDLAAWCNQPNLFKKMSFDKYIKKRHPKNINRQIKSLNLFYKGTQHDH